MTYQRMYHSTAILLPDGRVLASGGELPNQFALDGVLNFEIFSPGYLFQGSHYPRPLITHEPDSIALTHLFHLLSIRTL